MHAPVHTPLFFSQFYYTWSRTSLRESVHHSIYYLFENTNYLIGVLELQFRSEMVGILRKNLLLPLSSIDHLTIFASALIAASVSSPLCDTLPGRLPQCGAYRLVDILLNNMHVYFTLLRPIFDIETPIHVRCSEQEQHLPKEVNVGIGFH